MAGEGEYELLPHEEIQKLRDELDKFKKNPLGHTEVAKDLQTAVTDLTKAINSLTTLLTNTNDDLTNEFSKTSITEQFSQISMQNEQIAQGILSVAQLVQNQSAPAAVATSAPVSESVSSMPEQQFTQSMSGVPGEVPPMMGAPGMPPVTSMPDISGQVPPPPAFDLPPAPAKKKGLFGR